jgi:hypothetical protein
LGYRAATAIERLAIALHSPERLSLLERNAKLTLMTLIEIKPHRNGWKVFEAPGVEPVFLKKEQAINYAQNRASFRSGEIRILDSNGAIERVILFDETRRRL